VSAVPDATCEAERDRGRRHCLALTLPYPPGTNNLYATIGRRRVLSREGRDYKATCVLLALAAGCRPVVGPVGLEVTVYRPRRAGDLDGRLKVLLDAMTGVVWVDDRQVVELHAYRKDDKARPRAEVRVWPVEEDTTG
jgi:crossover junction endodeoxyribonuclease RusA